MPPPPAAPARPSPLRARLDTLWVLAVALVVYLLAGQRTLYGVDGWRLLRRIHAEDIRSDMHLLYKPLALLAKRTGEVLGAPMLESVVALSGVGTAIGVALCHAAARRLGVTRREALLLAALVGTAPGVVFYATVVERHGPFFAFYGFSVWAAAVLATRRTARGEVLAALLLAVATTSAYAAHSTGFLVLAVHLPLLAWFSRAGFADSAPRSWRRLWGLAALTCVATVVGMWGARHLGVLAGTVGDVRGNYAFFVQHASEQIKHPAELPRNLWQEIIQPFLPMSVLSLGLYRRGFARGLAAALGCAVLAYWGISFAILAGFEERGAYALPLAWPLALAVLLAWPRRFGWIAVAVAALLSALWIVRHDTEPFAARAEGMRALAAPGEPYPIAASPEDFSTLWGYFQGARSADDFYDAFDARAFPAETLQRFGALLVTKIEQLRAGRILLLSEDGLHTLEQPAKPGEAGPLVLELLRERYEFEPVASLAFHGYRLTPRP
ncbi:MAG: hypothetical protein IPM29_19215 [Planctomycetes bacterium]|nr:hypothetical protein [Planctomycetota bacterium]